MTRADLHMFGHCGRIRRRRSSLKRCDATAMAKVLRRLGAAFAVAMSVVVMGDVWIAPGDVVAADAAAAKPKSPTAPQRPIRRPSATSAISPVASGTGVAQQDGAASPATHRQERLIQVVSGQPNEKLTTFAVDAKGRVLAGVTGDNPMLRVYGITGNQVGQWALPVPPEAVNVGPRGDVFVAGQGVLLKLDEEGQITLKRDMPNMAGAADAAVGIQKRVQEQGRRDLNTRQQAQVQGYKKRLADIERKLADTDQDLVELDKKELAEEGDVDVEKIASLRTALQKRRANYVKLQMNLENNIRNPPSPKWATNRRGGPPQPQPEPEVDVRQLVAAQARVASISASKDEVFFTCSSSTGNGFDVWRTDDQFGKAKKIGESLRGCCGQMDVQANDNGIYVAENTRHRVRGFTRDGKQVLEFGSRERGREDAFEGCCNPMNVAFGDDGSVYTAESGSGRIKRFTADGKFMELVGQVELVPGCKKVSIAVSPKGDLVYMLDITRGHIVVMAGDTGQASARPSQSFVVAQASSR